MENELEPELMEQIRGIVENICEDSFPEIDMEYVKKASDYTIRRMWHIIMSWAPTGLKSMDLKRITNQ